MSQKQFESWIKKKHPQITDTARYPRTIKTISNHLKKKEFANFEIYKIFNVSKAEELKKKYFEIDEYFALNSRGNNMYSRAFDLYIQYLNENHINESINLDIQNIIEQTNIENTQKISLIKSRIGQGKFRENLIKLWGCCSVTGCSHVQLLIASHIKPWNKSDNNERLDTFNGFLLLPNIDKAFDIGLISFSNNGEIIISKSFSEYKTFGITSNMRIHIQERHKSYLEYHRSHVLEIT